MILLAGPIGTELGRRGFALSDRAWSAGAPLTGPMTLAQIHREYAEAGATVHIANTFRTTERAYGPGWEDLARLAVRLCRNATPGHRLAGSMAPLEDCYRPDLSPPEPRDEHRSLARVLAATEVDLLLCETFPHVGEALVAVEEAVATGRETWVSFTAGFRGDLLTPRAVEEGARQAARRGARAVLVNCLPADRALAYVERLEASGVEFGAYANAGAPEEGLGWGSDPQAPQRYADFAETWIRAGATLVGGCCGTGPDHVRELARRFLPTVPSDVSERR